MREEPESSIAMAEYVFLALRTVQGMSVQKFNDYFNADFFTYYGDAVAMLIRQKSYCEQLKIKYFLQRSA